MGTVAMVIWVLLVTSVIVTLKQNAQLRSRVDDLEDKVDLLISMGPTATRGPDKEG